MCGRFTLTIPDYDTLADALGVTADPAQAALYRPRYNVAPTDPHWIVRVKEGRRQLLPAKWGLVNSWAKDASGAARQINARAETVPTRPAFRDAFEKRRCVVPTDGFFEWIGDKGARRPVWFHPPAGGLLLLAGLYESWRDPVTDAWQRTFSIVTVGANELVAPVHDRMPAVLVGGAVQEWMASPGDSDHLARLEALLAPAPLGTLAATPVSSRANSVKNDDPACLVIDADEPPPVPPKKARRPKAEEPSAAEPMPLFDSARARRQH